MYRTSAGNTDMTIFEGLLMAHLLGDWILQTEWQAENKKRKFHALLIHVVIYHVIVWIILYFGFGLRSLPVLAVVIILAVLHAILDGWPTVKWIMKRLRLTVERTPERWLLVAVDQAIHLVLLGGASVYLSQFG